MSFAFQLTAAFRLFVEQLNAFVTRSACLRQSRVSKSKPDSKFRVNVFPDLLCVEGPAPDLANLAQVYARRAAHVFQHS